MVKDLKTMALTATFLGAGLASIFAGSEENVQNKTKGPSIEINYSDGKAVFSRDVAVDSSDAYLTDVKSFVARMTGIYGEGFDNQVNVDSNRERSGLTDKINDGNNTAPSWNSVNVDLSKYQNISGFEYIKNWPDSEKGEIANFETYRREFDDGSVSWLVKKNNEDFFVGALMYVDTNQDGKRGDEELQIRTAGIPSDYVQNHPSSSAQPSTEMERNSEEFFVKTLESIYQAGKREADNQNQMLIGAIKSVSRVSNSGLEKEIDRNSNIPGLTAGIGVFYDDLGKREEVLGSKFVLSYFGKHVGVGSSVEMGSGKSGVKLDDHVEELPFDMTAYGSLTQDSLKYLSGSVDFKAGGSVFGNYSLFGSVGIGARKISGSDEETAQILDSNNGEVLASDRTSDDFSKVTPYLSVGLDLVPSVGNERRVGFGGGVRTNIPLNGESYRPNASAYFSANFGRLKQENNVRGR